MTVPGAVGRKNLVARSWLWMIIEELKIVSFALAAAVLFLSSIN
jgi:hypothetical protein